MPPKVSRLRLRASDELVRVSQRPTPLAPQPTYVDVKVKIAVLHYHLNRGGVTQVVVNHLRSLSTAGLSGDEIEATIIYGGRRQGWPEGIADELAGIRLNLVPLAALDYDSQTQPAPDQLAAELAAALESAGAAPDDTVIHAHNHSLGKNVSFPGALARLADRGYRLLLQIHDFAEDFRPENYRRLEDARSVANRSGTSDHLYPQAQQIHYATLTRRDFDVLARAGVPSDRIHLLPNPVFDLGELPDRGQARAKLRSRFGVRRDARLLLYPVRGIRRKNVGEMLLWSVLAESDTHVGMTLKPLNPAEAKSYGQWRDLAAELQLPCVFGLGESGGLSFKENLSCADAILTTSVKEGFGMVFAEAWLAGRPLIGRDLPDITRDFVDAGLHLDTLRQRFEVPLSAVGRDDTRAALSSAYAAALDMYGRPHPSPENMGRAISEVLQGDMVDFAALTPTLQRRVIQSARERSDVRDELNNLNPWLEGLSRLCPETACDLIRHNAQVVRTNYSLAECGRRLSKVYQDLAQCECGPVESLPDGPKVLDFFLQFDRLRPVCLAT